MLSPNASNLDKANIWSCAKQLIASLIPFSIPDDQTSGTQKSATNAKQLGKIFTTENLLRITFSFNDLMLKTNRLKKGCFYKDRLIFGLDDPVANMSIRHVYYA